MLIWRSITAAGLFYLALAMCLARDLAPSTARAQDAGRGEIRLQSGGVAYVWDGSTLRSKGPAPGVEVWRFDGRYLRLQSGSQREEQSEEKSVRAYRWTGKELRPVFGTDWRQTFVWDGKSFKPKLGATHETTWRFDGRTWKTKQGVRHDNTWVVTGNVPVAVVGLVLFGVAR